MKRSENSTCPLAMRIGPKLMTGTSGSSCSRFGALALVWLALAAIELLASPLFSPAAGMPGVVGAAAGAAAVDAAGAPSFDLTTSCRLMRPSG